MSTPTRYLTDRTTIEKGWECGRSQFWYKHYDNKGIVPAAEAAYYQTGRQLHQAFADIVSGANWEKVCEELAEGYPPTTEEDSVVMETITWLIGMTAAFGKYFWPLLRSNYEPVLVEKELVLQRDPLWIGCTPDLVLRNKVTKELVVYDYKTSKFFGKGWFDHWAFAVQMHINIKAVEEDLNEPVKCAYVIGLPKGQDREGKRRHPYIWAYSDGQDQWQTDYSPKLTLSPVWTHPKGPVGWVEQLGEGIALQQFPVSAPIFLDDRLLNQLIKTTTQREEAIRSWTDQPSAAKFLDLFPQAFSRCRPSIGDACPYLMACHNAVIEDDPIGSGEYVYRTPHHDLELTLEDSIDD